MSVNETSEGPLDHLWRENRSYLVDLAFGVLGDVGAAEDAVQETFARLSVADLPSIDDPRAWLTVVTSRICFDQMKSARARRERPHEPSTLEVGPSEQEGQPVDPADRITLDDEVGLALLVVLQRLKPAERVAFVLHDVFQVPFDEVATTMGRPAATCRQLAKRARDKVRAVGELGADQEDPAHQQIVRRFIDACSNGNLTDLTALLDPGVWGDVDLGPADARTGRTVHGARAVGGNLLFYFGSGPTLVSHPGLPGAVVLAFVDGRVNAVILLTTSEENVIGKVHVIADPAKVGFLEAQLRAG